MHRWWSAGAACIAGPSRGRGLLHTAPRGLLKRRGQSAERKAMTTVPRNDAEGINFLLLHSRIWLEHAAEFGISPAEAQAVVERAEEAEAARNRALQARQESESATVLAREAIAALRGRSAAVIMAIKAHAAIRNDSTILNDAGIGVPSMRRAALPPARPRIVEAGLEPAGQVRLRWRVRHTGETRGEGTTYFVQRRLVREREKEGRPADEVWVQIGAAGGGVRRGPEPTGGGQMPASGWMFIDRDLPMGLSAVEYRIIAHRAGLEGLPSNVWRLTFSTLRLAA